MTVSTKEETLTQSENSRRGVKLLHDPVRNKGTAFSKEERDEYGLRGLLPPRINSEDTQVTRVMENLRRKKTDLEKYIFLVGLQDRNETLFYRVVIQHLQEIMPIIYTPTVGEACQFYGHIYRRSRGLWVTADDKGLVREVLRNWPHRDVRVIVVTDGERILGLGDLGANGMGIPIGKLALYTACAGIPPTACLPIALDLGTENKELLQDPLYIGLPRRRLRGSAYDELIEEFLTSVAEEFPGALIQLEDFANKNAFRLLEKYRDRFLLFDDDIQGTAGVVLSGLFSALRITGGKLSEERLLFVGAGEAGIGIARLIVSALAEEGTPEAEARRLCWFVDSKGLVVRSRTDLAGYKRPFAHDHPFTSDLLSAVEAIRPTAIIGVCGVPGRFSRPILEEMARISERPIVMALSNPTRKSECTARQAYTWTKGRAVFASGSPFQPVDLAGHTFVPGQANNAYIFPGVGLGATVCAASRITDEMFLEAAKALSGEVCESDLRLGRVYPSFSRIREVSAKIAAAVVELVHKRGLARAERPDDVLDDVQSRMFQPDYRRASRISASTLAHTSGS